MNTTTINRRELLGAISASPIMLALGNAFVNHPQRCVGRKKIVGEVVVHDKATADAIRNGELSLVQCHIEYEYSGGEYVEPGCGSIVDNCIANRLGLRPGKDGVCRNTLSVDAPMYGINESLGGMCFCCVATGAVAGGVLGQH